MRALAAALLVLAGCSSGTPFTARVTIEIDGAVDQATVERVRRYQIAISGDESLSDEIAVARGAREERFVYTALRTTKQLTLAIRALDGDGAEIAYGEHEVTLQSGGAVSATVVLFAPGSVDFARVEDMGRPPDLAGRDLLEADDLAEQPDMTLIVDMAPYCDPLGAQDSCSGVMLHRCKPDGTAFEDVTCDVNCSTTGKAHCVDLDPSGVLTVADVRSAATAEVVISADATFDTDSGVITGGVVRDGGVGILANISFQTVAQPGAAKEIGVFGFKKLTIIGGATVRATGMRALAIVATGDVVVNGRIELQTCSGLPSAGGFSGGVNGMGGGSGGATGLAFDGGVAGGGGGGSGEAGGKGGSSASHTNGVGGVALPDIASEAFFLVGGGGGGGGMGPADAGAGGNGGGAVQIATLGALTVNGVIHAGGCGGIGHTSTYGSGGGAGGTIVLEASSVSLGVGSVIAANGGAGSAPLTAAPGGSGQSAGANASITLGGTGAGMPTGGSGGAAGSIAGGNGAAQLNKDGAGGGGAAGRIAIKSATGTITNSGAVLSPNLTDMTSGGVKVAIVAQAKFQ